MRPVPLVLALLAVLLALPGGVGGASLPAGTTLSAAQGAANLAGVVIADPNGGPPKTVCVRFAAESITGRQLLDLANERLPSIDPVYSTQFGNQGTAVCALCGTGCPADDCFCQERYWNYSVARDGAWARSGVGVDRRTVRHGDVDGWAFGGDGAAPPFIRFETICAAEASPPPSPSPSPTATASPSATPTPTATSPSPTTSPRPVVSPTPSAPTSPTESPAPSTAASAPAPAGPPDEPAVPRTTSPPSDDETASAQPANDASGPDGSGVGDALVFGGLLAGLGGLLLWRRRGR